MTEDREDRTRSGRPGPNADTTVERLLTLAEQQREVNARLLRVVEALAARVEVLELERLHAKSDTPCHFLADR